MAVEQLLYYRASSENVSILSDCVDKQLTQVLKKYDVFSDSFLQQKVGTILHTGIPKVNYDSNYNYFGTSLLQLENGQSCQWTTCTKQIPRNSYYIVTSSDPLLYDGTNNLNESIQIQVSYFPDYLRQLKITTICK